MRLAARGIAVVTARVDADDLYTDAALTGPGAFVLGSEADALRYAQNELDDLTRQVERDAEARAAGREQLLVAGVGLLGRPEPRELPHRPEPSAVHRGVDAARGGRVAGETHIALGLPIGEVRRGVKPANRVPRNRGKVRGPFSRLFGCRLRKIRLPFLFAQ